MEIGEELTLEWPLLVVPLLVEVAEPEQLMVLQLNLVLLLEAVEAVVLMSLGILVGLLEVREEL
jgi:hypothetical protein